MKFLLMLCTLCVLSWPSMARDLTIELHSPEWLTKAREAIDGKNYDLAINVLTQADEKQSADWHNLMGFSLRLKSPPQLVRAELNSTTKQRWKKTRSTSALWSTTGSCFY